MEIHASFILIEGNADHNNRFDGIQIRFLHFSIHRSL